MYLSEAQCLGIRLVITRALNKNQLLILSSISEYTNITDLLEELSKKSSIPLSTLKLNARVLRSLGIIEYNVPPVRVTPAGRAILEIIKSDIDD